MIAKSISFPTVLFLFFPVESRIGVLGLARIGVHTAENVSQVRVCQHKKPHISYTLVQVPARQRVTFESKQKDPPCFVLCLNKADFMHMHSVPLSETNGATFGIDCAPQKTTSPSRTLDPTLCCGTSIIVSGEDLWRQQATRT